MEQYGLDLDYYNINDRTCIRCLVIARECESLPRNVYKYSVVPIERARLYGLHSGLHGTADNGNKFYCIGFSSIPEAEEFAGIAPSSIKENRKRCR